MAKFHISFPNSNITSEEYKHVQEFLKLLIENHQVGRIKAGQIKQVIDWQTGVSIELPPKFSTKQEKGELQLFYSIKGNSHLIAANNSKKGTDFDLENFRKILGIEEVEQMKNTTKTIPSLTPEPKKKIVSKPSSSYAQMIPEMTTGELLAKLSFAVKYMDAVQKEPPVKQSNLSIEMPQPMPVAPNNTVVSLQNPNTKSNLEKEYDDCGVPFDGEDDYVHPVPSM